MLHLLARLRMHDPKRPGVQFRISSDSDPQSDTLKVTCIDMENCACDSSSTLAYIWNPPAIPVFQLQSISGETSFEFYRNLYNTICFISFEMFAPPIPHQVGTISVFPADSSISIAIV